MNKYSDLPREDNPKDRIREMGPGALSRTEVLAVALRINDIEAGKAISELYKEFGSINAIPRHRIVEIKGLGEGYADTIQAIGEIVRRESQKNFEDKPSIHCPKDAADLVQYEMAGLEVEQLRVILLDTRNRVKKIVTLYQGSVNSGQVRTAEVFRDAIRENATAIVVVHNHPSGDPTPSGEDISVTRNLVQTGKMLDIEVLDHVIIGKGRFKSLKESGLGF